MKLPSKYDWALISISVTFLSIFLIPWDKVNEVTYKSHTSSITPTKHIEYKGKTVHKDFKSNLDTPNKDLVSKEIEIYQDQYEDYIQDPEDELRFPPEIFGMYSE